jgi:hypothetical protein
MPVLNAGARGAPANDEVAATRVRDAMIRDRTSPMRPIHGFRASHLLLEPFRLGLRDDAGFSAMNSVSDAL